MSHDNSNSTNSIENSEESSGASTSKGNSFVKRSNYIINKRFQYTYILLSLVPLILIFIAMYVAHTIFYQQQVAFGQELKLSPDHVYFAMIDYQQQQLNKTLIALGTFIGLINIIWSIFISHRVAGPLYRLTQFFKQASESKQATIPQLKFRPKDFFLEIPEAFNKFADRLNQQLKK